MTPVLADSLLASLLELLQVIYDKEEARIRVKSGEIEIEFELGHSGTDELILIASYLGSLDPRRLERSKRLFDAQKDLVTQWQRAKVNAEEELLVGKIEMSAFKRRQEKYDSKIRRLANAVEKSLSPVGISLKIEGPHDESSTGLVRKTSNADLINITSAQFVQTVDPIVSLKARNRQILLSGLPLSPSNLVNHYAPYINAVSVLQSILSKVKHTNYQEPIIQYIRAGSAEVGFDIDMGDGLRALNDIVSIPKRKQEEELRKVQIDREHLDNYQKQLEQDLLLKTVQIETDPELIEAEKKKRLTELDEANKKATYESETKLLELRRAQFALEKEQITFYIDIALDLVNKTEPNLSPGEKRALALELVPVVRTIRDSPVAPPKPPLLPEQ